MKLSLKALVGAALLALSVNAMSAGVVSENMRVMGREMQSLKEAEDSQSFVKHAQVLREAAAKAAYAMPDSLEGDQEEFKRYQKDMGLFIKQLDGAIKSAKANKLAEAKAMLSTLEQKRREDHQKYR